MAIVGVAQVKVTPDLSTFRRELKKGLQSIKADFTVNVQADVTKARTQIQEFVAKQGAKDITKNLDLDTSKASRALKEFAAKLKLEQALAGATNGLKSFTTAGLGLAKVSAAFTAVQAVSSSLGPLLVSAAGAAALLPAAILGGVASMAALKLGADGAKKAFEGLKPALDNLKASVSASFQSALTPAVNNLKAILPQLKSGFQQIVTAMGGAVTQATSLLNTSSGIKSLQTLLSGTARVIQNVSQFLAPVVAAFVNIGAIGMPILQNLTAGFGGLGQQFLAFTQSAEGIAKIQQFITGALNAIGELGKILQQVAGIATNLFTGLASGGASLGSTLLPIVTSINQALGSAGMQAALGAIGTALREIGTAVGASLGPVVKTVLPLLGQALLAAAPGIAALVNGFGQLIQGIAPALPAVGQLASVLGQGLGAVASALGPVLGDLAKTLAGTLAQAIPALVPVVIQLVQAFGKILTAVAPLIGPIIELVSAALDPILAVVQALIPPFTELVNSVLMVIKPLIPPLSQAFTALGQALAPLAGALGQALVQIFQAIAPAIGPLVNVVTQLVQAFVPLIPPITSTIQILTPIIALVAQVAAAFISFQAQALEPIIKVFGFLAQTVGSAMTSMNQIIGSVVSSVTGFFSNLVSRITGAWSSITSTIGNAVSNVKNAVVSGFNNVVSFISGIPGKILSAIGNFGSLLFNAGADLLRGLVRGISSMISGVINSVVDVGRKILNGIKGALGIGSPSREFAKVGVWTMQGLHNGLEDGFRPVDTLMSDLAQRIQDSFGTPTLDVATGVAGAVRSSIETAASVEQRPVNVTILGDERGLRQFVQVQIEEGNQDVRRFVNSGKGGLN